MDERLATAIIGAAVALLAVVVGSVVQGRREHGNWLRDRRLDAFAAFGGQANRASVAVGNYFNDPTQSEELRARFDEQLGELATANVRVALLSPGVVANAARDILDHFNGELYPLTGHHTPLPSLEKREALTQTLRRLHGEYLQVASRQLGIAVPDTSDDAEPTAFGSR